ncbi:hypothetical protein EJ110_NYTH27791 [Nymphaea thermarum]|nr:hypothetical protein EJ110_NYTH27791 [Nymphaea thermarum]
MGDHVMSRNGAPPPNYSSTADVGDKKKKRKKKKKKGKKTSAEQASATKYVKDWFYADSTLPSSPPSSCLADFEVPKSVWCPEPIVFELHSHSICSDGFLSPSALVERAHRKGGLVGERKYLEEEMRKERRVGGRRSDREKN